jgi:hypothetical protein
MKATQETLLVRMCDVAVSAPMVNASNEAAGRRPVARVIARCLTILFIILLVTWPLGCSSNAGSGKASPPIDSGSAPPDSTEGDSTDTPPEDSTSDSTDTPPEDSTSDSTDTPPEDSTSDSTVIPSDSTETDAGEECTTAAVLKPTGIELTIDPMPNGFGPWKVHGLGDVMAIGPYPGGSQWQWELKIALKTGTTVGALMKLPVETPLPLAVGDSVSVYAEMFAPFWFEYALYIAHIDGTTAFAFYDGSHGTDAFGGCGGLAGCPVVSQLETTCKPVDDGCAPAVSPPVKVDFDGETLELNQGDVGQGSGGQTVLLAKSHKYVESPSSACPDTPSTWLDVIVIGAPHASCKTNKIGLTQANPEKFEFYELCVDEKTAPENYEAALKAIDSSLYCGVKGVFAQCADGTVGCHGDLTYEANTKTLSDEMWTKLCGLAAQSWVSKVAGGHFL